MKLFCFFMLLSLTAHGQHQEQRLCLYNIGFGGFTSAIGAVINKPKKADWKPYFIRGLWQGGIGGALSFAGKKTTYLINKDRQFLYAWPSKILHSAGASIVENAGLNRPFLQNWNIDFGPARFDFSLNGNERFKARIFPLGVYSIVDGFIRGKFDPSTTLLTGQMTFKSKNKVQNDFYGYSSGHAIVYDAQNSDKYHAVAHEIVHQFQFREYLNFNSWTKPITSVIKSIKIKTALSRYVYIDVPYFWLAYGLEGNHSLEHYYKNYFEFEAERLSTHHFVQQ